MVPLNLIIRPFCRINPHGPLRWGRGHPQAGVSREAVAAVIRIRYADDTADRPTRKRLDLLARKGGKMRDRQSAPARLPGVEASERSCIHRVSDFGVESRNGAVSDSDPFPSPAHQTGRADFQHPAFRQTSHESTRRLCPCQALDAQSSVDFLGREALGSLGRVAMPLTQKTSHPPLQMVVPDLVRPWRSFHSRSSCATPVGLR